jgi:hypothetical protein
MVAIVTREVGATAKGSPLTNAEVDNNFINLEEGKIERFVACKNETGSTAAIGTVVYITGSTGTNPIFALAAASSEATSSKTFGIVWPAAINNNAVGNVITQGIITGLNTSAYSAGAALWLSTTAGSLTATKPTQPNHSVFIGYVVRSHATEGSIQVKILNGYELDELHDVLITSPAYRQFLYRNASNTLWINGFIQDVIGAKIGSAPDEIPLNQYLGDLAYQSSKSVSIDLLNATTISSTNGATIQGLTIGRGAGAVDTNTAVGASALAATTTGDNLVGVGYGALQTNTTGPRNVAVGRNALYANTTNGDNTALGHASLGSSTGSNNTAVGSQALTSNTTASNNTAVGYQALYTNTTGTINTALGTQAGYSNTTSTESVYVGYRAGYLTTGEFNTFVGGEAGRDVTTGTRNTLIGIGAGYLMTTGGKNTVIGNFSGNQGGLDIRTANNYIVLSDGDGNPRVTIDSSGYTQTGDKTFVVYGDKTQYHPVLIFPGNNSRMITVYRHDVHQDELWRGAGMIRLFAYGFGWGTSAQSLVADITIRTDDSGISPFGAITTYYPSNTGVVVFLRGGTTFITDGIIASNQGTFIDAATVVYSSTTVGSGTYGNGLLYKGRYEEYGPYNATIAPNSPNLIANRGIQFPATQNASSNANTLDDYEEGTWTPTYYGSTSAGTTTYVTQSGIYTKVGRVVTATFNLSITNATGTGDIRIGGLPFASDSSAANQTMSAIAADALTWTGDYLVLYVQNNTSIGRVYRVTAGSGLNDTAIDTACSLYATVTYIASA